MQCEFPGICLRIFVIMCSAKGFLQNTFSELFSRPHNLIVDLQVQLHVPCKYLLNVYCGSVGSEKISHETALELQRLGVRTQPK